MDRRRFLIDSVSFAGVGMISAILPRHVKGVPCPPPRLSIAGGTSVTTDCVPAAYTATHYVSPTATGSGTGTQSNPWTLAQAVANAVAGDVVQCAPGSYLVAAGGATSSRDPALVAGNSGTPTNRIVFTAAVPAILATSDAQRTIIRATSGVGSILGSGPNTSGGGDYVTYDGFQLEVGGTYDSTDTGSMFTSWNTVGVKVTRCVFDEAGHAPPGTRNWGSIFAQYTSGLEVADCIIKNQVHSGVDNHCSLMLYDSDNFEIHHCNFQSLDNAFFPKGSHTAQDFTPGSFHHNRIDDCLKPWVLGGIGGQGDGQYLDIYQNTIWGGSRVNHRAYSDFVPRFVRVVNNTFFGMNNSTYSVMFFTTAGANSFNEIRWHNNIFHTLTGARVYGGDIDPALIERMTFDYNGYFACPNIKQGVSFAAWQSTWGNDAHGTDADPLLVDPANRNLRLGSSSPYRNAGIDVLNLLGQGTSASINLGAYITSDMSDRIGVRI